MTALDVGVVDVVCHLSEEAATGLAIQYLLVGVTG